MPTSNLIGDFTLEDVNLLVQENPFLRGYLQGYLAELALRRQIEKIPGVESIVKIADHSKEKGDLRVMYRGEVFTIECKSVQSGSVKEDVLNQAWTGRVIVKNPGRHKVMCQGEERDVVNVDKGQFDILAVNCFAVNGEWEFLFIENRLLYERADMPGFILSSFLVNPYVTPGATSSLPELLDRLSVGRASGAGSSSVRQVEAAQG